MLHGYLFAFLCHRFHIMLVDMAALNHACVVWYDVCFNEIATLCLTFDSKKKIFIHNTNHHNYSPGICFKQF